MTMYDEHLQAGDPGDAPDLCDAVHPDDAKLPDPIPEGWHAYRRVCHLPAGHPPLADGLGAHESEQGDRWNDRAPEPPNLPAPFGSAGELDLDTLRTLAPRVRNGLVQSLRYSATLLRQGRGTVIVPEDTFDLVRRVTAAEEVLRQYAQAFTAAAAECVAIAEEEALTANGSYPGVEEAPSGSLFVPDGAGQRIAVRPEWKSGDSEWDVPTLVGWLIDDEVENTTASLDDGEQLDRTDLAQTARNVVARLIGLDGVLGLGRYTPGAKALDVLRKRLAEQQRDSDAAVIRQVRSTGPRKYIGVKVTREEA